MSAAAVQSKILEPMQQIFLPPRDMAKADQAGALRQYVGVLSRFDEADLSAAWAQVIEVHPNRSWPLPSVIAAAARGAVKDRTGGTPKATRHSGEDHDSAARWETWKAVSRSPLAVQAVEMNSAWTLKCAILHDGKRPEEINIRALAAGKRSAERTAQKIRNAEPHERNGRNIGVFSEGNATVALRMWNQLLIRENETQVEIKTAQRN